ncbi:MAG: RNA polymerase sigma factor [Gemmataceae bacterium]
MSPTRNEFQELMQRLRQGSDGAARELLNRYGPHIQQVIRQRLHRKLRPKFDSIDFTQAVWASFFADQARLKSFDSPETLTKYLGALARNKVVEAVRQRIHTGKFDVNKELPLQRPGSEPVPVPAMQPTASQFVMAEEEWNRLARGQPPYKRQILSLLRQGYTHQEIAEKIGVNEKTIRRLVRQLHPGLG